MSSTVVTSPAPELRPAPTEPTFLPRPAVESLLFLPDGDDNDTLGRAAAAFHLAGLLAHPNAGTPFLIGITGSAGSGKSSFLGQILRALGGAGAAGTVGSRLARVMTVRVDASSNADATASILSRLLSTLGADYPHLAEEAAFAGGDPLKLARTAGERVNEARRQLDGERQTLQDLNGRQARLADTVLFNAPGSRVESYARQNRGGIEARLRGFGFASSDPVSTFKELVRDAAESGGGRSRVGLALRALWAFKGQGTLLVLAVLLLLAGWGCGLLAENQDDWLSWLHGFGDKVAGLSAWAQAHADWLGPLSHAAYALAALAVLVDIIRAIRFVQPVFRGVSLFGSDLEERRRDLDSSLAHQTRRVDHLTGEVEAAVRSADAAERRVETRKAAGLLHPALTLIDRESGSAAQTSEAVLAGLSDAMATGPSPAESGASAPERIVVAIDELDRLSPQAAAEFLDTAQRLLRRPRFAAIAAFERSHVMTGFSETDPGLASAQLDRCVQLSYDLDADDAGLEAAPRHAGSGLDQPWSATETRLVQALMPHAGPKPRTMKRFMNSFRIARSDPRLTGATDAELAGLAVALALDGNGAAAELSRYREGSPESELGPGTPSLLGQSLAVAQDTIGEIFTAADARRGLELARIYSRYG